MRKFIISDSIVPLTYLLPDKCCAFCSHCSDIFYDYTNGPYIFLCTKDNDTTAWNTCADFDDIEGDNNATN